MNVILPLFANEPFFNYSTQIGEEGFDLHFKYSTLTESFSVTLATFGVPIAYCVPVNLQVNLFRGTSYRSDDGNELWLRGAEPTLGNFGMENQLVFGYGALIK